MNNYETIYIGPDGQPNGDDEMVPMIFQWDTRLRGTVRFEMFVPKGTTTAQAIEAIQKQYPELVDEPGTYHEVILPPDADSGTYNDFPPLALPPKPPASEP